MLPHPPTETAPLDAWPVTLSDGEPAVEWGDQWGPVDPGPILEPFADLATVAPEALPQEVAAFVRRFGPLGLCDVHHRYRNAPDHPRDSCQPVRPEPVMEWRTHVGAVARVLFLRDAIRRAEREGIPFPDALQALHESTGFDGDRAAFAIERARRTDPDGEWWARAGLAEWVRHDMESGPGSVAEAWEAVRAFVGYGLAAYPSRAVALKGDGGARLALQPEGILGRVYIELASELTGSRKPIAWCDGCGQPHRRERAPKRGQGC